MTTDTHAFSQWNLGGNNMVQGVTLPGGDIAVWFPEGCCAIHDEPTLCVFMATDEFWARPILQTPCASLEEAQVALSAHLA